jgi:hypothetical protein
MPRRLICAADAGYFDMLRVSIASFLRHNDPARGGAAGASTSLAREELAGALPGTACKRARLAGNESDGWDLGVVDVGLTSDQRHILRRMGIEVMIYPVHRVIPGNVGAWARLRMLEDFTSDGELLLYLDADTLVLGSVEPMVDGFLESEQAIGLATEMIDTEWEPPTMVQAFADRPAPGFPHYENWKDHLVMNTGVLLARGPTTGEIARQCTALYPRICEGAKWAEQSILDAVLLDRGYGWWEIPPHQHCLARGDLIEHTGPIHESGATYRGWNVIVRHFCGRGQKDRYAYEFRNS